MLGTVRPEDSDIPQHLCTTQQTEMKGREAAVCKSTDKEHLLGCQDLRLVCPARGHLMLLKVSSTIHIVWLMQSGI